MLAATAVAVTVAQTAVAAPLAFSPDLVRIHPTATHVGFAQAAPPTTAQCESDFQIACSITSACSGRTLVSASP